MTAAPAATYAVSPDRRGSVANAAKQIVRTSTLGQPRRTQILAKRTKLSGAVVYFSGLLVIVPVEVDILNFRYFDANDHQLTNEQLKTMNVVTPAMEHVFATVLNRVGKLRNQADTLEDCLPRQYN